MKRVDLALRIVAVALLAISVSGLAVRASDGTCATCTGWRGDLLVQGCPYTQVLDCWCESSIEICCLYEICQLGPGGRCNQCWTYEHCIYNVPCSDPLPTFVPLVRRLK